ncbi:PfkB family carbohydrate kinase [Calidithermus roseus]|uniref:Sulfofructose kinase n=1 Tax=Calidithermus roseus TaxID=1644118 RepID=A0A399EXJ9_9DEIN|nr:PfkB family carbohydrate kinase [Calidithermus roseus]RIH89294.1 Sulfofructose kinase [Calidithermus roseus]
MASVITLGWACLDQRFYLERFPPTHSRTPVRAFRQAIGGPAAVAAQAVARLGGEALLLSRRGSDTVGESLEAALRAEGVRTRFTLGQETPISAVLVAPDGERYIFPYRPDLPAEPDWDPEVVLEGVGAVLLDHRWVLAGLRLAQAARARGIPVVLDLDHDRPEAWELVPLASHVVASEELARHLGGVEALLGRIPGWAAVTLGAEGVRHRRGQIPAFRVEVRDSTGAGDVYHGAFALGLAEGMGEEGALRFAAAVAALHVQNGEPPGRREVEALLAS